MSSVSYNSFYKPKVLLIADVPNWIFHRHAKIFQKYLSDEFDFVLLFQGQAFEEDDYDLIYPLEFQLVLAERIKTPRKYVTGIRSNGIWWNDISINEFAANLQKNFQKVHVISKELYNIFIPLLPTVKYITNGVETQLFKPNTSANISGKKLRLGWAGNREQSLKGFSEFIEPLGKIRDVELVYCGYSDQNLSQEEMVDFYNSFDAYVCASKSEGANNSLLEAASMERAIITTNVGTVCEYLKDGESAVIVDRNLPAFIKAVEYLRDNPDLRVRLGVKARLSVLGKGLDWKNKVEDFRLFFRDAIKRNQLVESSNDMGKNILLANTNAFPMMKDANFVHFAEFLANRIGCEATVLEDLSSISTSPKYPSDSIILIPDGIKALCEFPHLVVPLGEVTKEERKIIFVDDIDSFLDISQIRKITKKFDLSLEFLGYAKDDDGRMKYVTILSESLPEKSQAVPDDFQVVALLATYNEIDIIAPVIKDLVQNQINVYVIDNWSTDGTFEKVQQMLNQGITGIERWPLSGPTDVYDWTGILKRKEQLSNELDASWFIHQDADEFREAPWEKLNLREAIYFVDAQGYNAIDFTVLDFMPVDNSYRQGSSPEKHFKYFGFGVQSSDFLQIKAWKKCGELVDLSRTGGHAAEFPSQRVFPYKFLLKHYPIRSQEHGEKKVFDERKARWSSSERQMGWHTHYDSYDYGASFLKNRKGLVLFENDFYKNYLFERLSGIGIKNEVEREKTYNFLNSEIIRRKAEIEQFAKEITGQKDKTLQLTAELSEQKEKLARLTKRSCGQKEKIIRLTNELTEKNRLIDQVSSQLSEKESEATRLANEIATKNEEIVSYALSRSWRFTRPLRKLKKFLLKGKNA